MMKLHVWSLDPVSSDQGNLIKFPPTFNGEQIHQLGYHDGFRGFIFVWRNITGGRTCLKIK